MKLKDGVEIDHLHPDLVAVLPFIELEYGKTLQDNGLHPNEITITSGHEGEPMIGPHSKKSKHYIVNCPSGFGEAIDVRANDILATIATEAAGRIAMQLRIFYPNKYKVFFEECLKPSCHIHVQIRT